MNIRLIEVGPLKSKSQEDEMKQKHLPMPQSEPIGHDIAHQGRLRRATISPGSVDKYVIKGSMAKVVGSAAAGANSFQRMLK